MSEDGFISRLKELARREERGALAALRRGLGRPPGAAVEMHAYVMPFLPKEGPWTWWHQCHYVVASLFGMHPESASTGNMGDTFRQIQMASAGGGESIEKRFMALLKCHRDDLFDHLRQAVSLARSKDVRVCWERLLRDIKRWDDDRGWVQRKWSQSFWSDIETVNNQPAETLAKGEQP